MRQLEGLVSLLMLREVLAGKIRRRGLERFLRFVEDGGGSAGQGRAGLPVYSTDVELEFLPGGIVFERDVFGRIDRRRRRLGPVGTSHDADQKYGDEKSRHTNPLSL